MPKFIRFAGENILAAARKRMLSNKKKDLSLRNIADDCGIAVGTIYNYYNDKEDIVYAVITKDWDKLLKKAEIKILKAETIGEGMTAVYDAVFSLRKIYRKYWETNYDAASAKEAASLHRTEFISSLTDIVEKVLGRFMDDYTRSDARMFAELISASAVKDLDRTEFEQFFRLIKTNR